MPIKYNDIYLMLIGYASSFVDGWSVYIGSLFELLVCAMSELWSGFKHDTEVLLGKIFGNSGASDECSKPFLSDLARQNRKNYKEKVVGIEVPMCKEEEGRVASDLKKRSAEKRMERGVVEDVKKIYKRVSEEGKKMLVRPVQFDPQGIYIDGGVLDSIIGASTRDLDDEEMSWSLESLESPKILRKQEASSTYFGAALVLRPIEFISPE